MPSTRTKRKSRLSTALSSIDRVSDKLHLGDDLDQLFADAALSLDGCGADVRRAGDHRVGVERDVGRGLVGIDVQTGGADLAAVERVKKRSLVDVGAVRKARICPSMKSS